MYTLLSTDQIARRITELGQSIADEYRQRPLTILGVLNGSLILVADLMRSIHVPHRVGFIRASSYRGASTQGADLTTDLQQLPDIRGRDVLLVDDILDTGRTLQRLVAQLTEFKPATVRTAVLLWKLGRQQVDLTPDYHGFQIPDQFVVGYGLDYNDDYRHLPEIAVLEPDDLT